MTTEDDASTPADEVLTPPLQAAIGTVAGYLLILGLMTTLLFFVPYLIFSTL